VQYLELGAVEDFFDQLELIFKGREQGIALNHAPHKGQV
jgi:hypothetical protein